MRERLIASQTHPDWGWGIEPAIQLCSLDRESSPRPLGVLADTLTTEPPWPGPMDYFFLMVLKK